MIDTVLSEAVIAYVGIPGRLDSVSPETRVIDRVGEARLDLVSTVKRIVDDEVYGADPPLHNRPTVSYMAEAVRDLLRSRHPELSDEAVSAVANRFAFDWK